MPRPSVHRSLAALSAALVVLALSLVAPATASAAPYHPRTSYESWVAGKVETQLNAERHAHGVARVYMSMQLILSARGHNYRMALHNTLSHQLSGEAPFYARMTARGYHWTYAGENIAYTTSIHYYSVLALESAMYNEKAPYDGHRLNILNPHYRDVGIDVYYDSGHHKLWLTVDFGHR